MHGPNRSMTAGFVCDVLVIHRHNGCVEEPAREFRPPHDISTYPMVVGICFYMISLLLFILVAVSKHSMYNCLAL